ncbi:G1/S-specific cyclin-E1-like [Discoglossus pictus]
MPVMSLEEGSAKENGAENTAVRSRKRKADVAIFLQDPDENVEIMEMTRKKQYANRAHKNSGIPHKSPCKFLPTPEKEDTGPRSLGLTQFLALRFSPISVSPLPHLGWANQDDVWRNMVSKDRNYPRDKNLFEKHPQLQPSMRAILLDWLMEVCEVYKLHRETFYLAQDFFDRFMATQQNIVKNRLQLIGIASLFVAAKLEEIYPPKLCQFAFITDSACTEDEILSMELLIMKVNRTVSLLY